MITALLLCILWLALGHSIVSEFIFHLERSRALPIPGVSLGVELCTLTKAQPDNLFYGCSRERNWKHRAAESLYTFGQQSTDIKCLRVINSNSLTSDRPSGRRIPPRPTPLRARHQTNVSEIAFRYKFIAEP